MKLAGGNNLREKTIFFGNKNCCQIEVSGVKLCILKLQIKFWNRKELFPSMIKKNVLKNIVEEMNLGSFCPANHSSSTCVAVYQRVSDVPCRRRSAAARTPPAPGGGGGPLPLPLRLHFPRLPQRNILRPIPRIQVPNSLPHRAASKHTNELEKLYPSDLETCKSTFFPSNSA